MVIPTPPPSTPNTVGSAPISADVLNQQLGFTLKQFTTTKAQIATWKDWLLTVDLKVEPYFFSTEQETLIKSAINDLDAALDAINMTFVIRLTGPF